MNLIHTILLGTVAASQAEELVNTIHVQAYFCLRHYVVRVVDISGLLHVDGQNGEAMLACVLRVNQVDS